MKFSHSLLTLFKLILLTLFLTSCESLSVIINGIDEREANEILVVLNEANIEGEKQASEGKVINWNIAVPKSNKIEALTILTRRGYPRSKRENVLQIINQSSGLVPSDTTEELKFREGKARQIENTILKMDGVIDASVEISYPKSDPLNPSGHKPPLTASVYVKLEGPLDPNNQLVSRVKRLVSSSINNLEFDNVTVITDQQRLNDYSSSGKAGTSQALNPNLVKTWGVTMTKSSQATFQTIFSSLLALLLFSLSLLAFLFFKLSRIFALLGGARALFSFTPYKIELAEEEDEEDEEDEDEDEDEEEDEDEDEEDTQSSSSTSR